MSEVRRPYRRPMHRVHVEAPHTDSVEVSFPQRKSTTGAPYLQENATPWDPTVGLCLGS